MCVSSARRQAPFLESGAQLALAPLPARRKLFIGGLSYDTTDGTVSAPHGVRTVVVRRWARIPADMGPYFAASRMSPAALTATLLPAPRSHAA